MSSVDLGLLAEENEFLLRGIWVVQVLLKVWQVADGVVVNLQGWVILEDFVLRKESHEVNQFEEEEINPGWLLISDQKLV